MRDDERLLLLAWPRSGSSSLWEILRSHPDLHLLQDEPFNEHFAEWAPGNPDYLARIHDTDTLDEVVDELFRTYAGIKVLSYQLDEQQLTHLLARPHLRVIHIRRRNLLRIAVSDRIAKQTGIFNRWDLRPDEAPEDRYRDLAPLDIDDLRGYLDELVEHLAWVDSVLDGRDDTLRIDYDDLYYDAPTEQLARLWPFLGVEALDSAEVAYFLDPQTAKLGTVDTYGRLPNAAEIDRALGADDTGWL